MPDENGSNKLKKKNRKYLVEQQEKLDKVKRILISKRSKEVKYQLEKRVLGKAAIIKDTSSPEAFEFCKLEEDDFDTPINKLIFNYEKNQLLNSRVISFNDLTLHLSSDDETREVFENSGKDKYLYELISSSNGTYKQLTDVVKQLKVTNNQTNIINKSIKMINDISADIGNSDAEKNIEDIKRGVSELSRDIAVIQDSEDSLGTSNLGELLEAWSQSLYEMRRDGGANIGKYTGFEKLDDAINGFREGQMVVIGARPAVGKSAFSLNLVDRFLNNDAVRMGDTMDVQVKENKPEKMNGIFFSLEMTSTELIERIIAQRTLIDVPSIRSASITDADWVDVLYSISTDDTKNRFFLNENPSLTIQDIKNEIEKVSREVDHLDFIFVDYLQLVNSSNNNRQQAIAEISRQLKIIAKQYHTTVFALSQLNREVEHTDTGRPTLADLRESGQIEQDADIVIMLSRDKMLDKEKQKQNEDTGKEIGGNDDPDVKINVEIVKNRSGKCMLIPFVFRQPIQSFSELTEEEDQEYFQTKEFDANPDEDKVETKEEMLQDTIDVAFS